MCNEVLSDELTDAEILEQVLADWFPNAESEEDINYEVECLDWDD